MTTTEWHPFRFLLSRLSRQITADGTNLVLNPVEEGGHNFNATFSINKIGMVSEFGDILALRVRIPDAGGNVWETVSRFTTAALIKYLGDLVYAPTWPRFFDASKPAMAAPFEDGLLIDTLHYTNDGRYVRNIAVENKILGSYYKYSLITFDIGIPLRDDKSIAIKATGVGQALRTESGDNPAIYYHIPITYLMQHNTMSDIIEDYVGENDIPEPLIFTRIDLKGDPQPGVREIA